LLTIPAYGHISRLFQEIHMQLLNRTSLGKKRYYKEKRVKLLSPKPLIFLEPMTRFELVTY
jgi:hypothetical protein